MQLPTFHKEEDLFVNGFEFMVLLFEMCSKPSKEDSRQIGIMVILKTWTFILKAEIFRIQEEITESDIHLAKISTNPL